MGHGLNTCIQRLDQLFGSSHISRFSCYGKYTTLNMGNFLGHGKE